MKMQVRLFNFLKSVFGEGNVSLAYGDRVTGQGLSVVFYDDGIETEKQLDGTTNNLIGTFVVQVWHDTDREVLKWSDLLFDKMEGTDFQIQSIRSVRVDGRKRKWHRDIRIRIMEDVPYGGISTSF